MKIRRFFFIYMFMKIKRFNEINENNSGDKKFYIYRVHPGDKTYRSIWDSPSKPWVPNDAKLIGEFTLDKWNYLIVSQEELDEINEIKLKNNIEKDSKKYNL